MSSIQTALSSRLKSVVSVSEMARMVQLSRARFYELVGKGVFLPPVYTVTGRRPLYTRDMQQTNLVVRHEQMGVNGEYVVFYEQRSQDIAPAKNPSRKAQTNKTFDGLVQQLQGLGLIAVTSAQAEEAVHTCFPGGTASVDEPVILRTVFRHLRRQNDD
ncbi:hypothetical protein ACERK3_14165 [Phycisphaerales bacterium AB-hyl4]|uniref:Uncharacterized protein n=1 Tax=Natronomicrosphaera hydrolytica TaxID=3242702 RepID=A0ABV4U758_9BACT